MTPKKKTRKAPAPHRTGQALQLYLPPALKTRLKEAAKAQRRTMAAVIRNMIDDTFFPNAIPAYQISAEWSPEDKVYVARSAQWESIATHGDTEHAAMNELRVVIAACVNDLRRNGEPIPRGVS